MICQRSKSLALVAGPFSNSKFDEIFEFPQTFSNFEMPLEIRNCKFKFKLRKTIKNETKNKKIHDKHNVHELQELEKQKN